MVCARLTQRHLYTLPVIALAALAALSIAGPAAARGSGNSQQDEVGPARPAGAPMLAVVGLKDQRITVYDADGAILKAPVSSGQIGYETPVGIYAVLQKEAEHYSNRYDDAAMPFMQRITWTGIALHAGALPGYPASHGCVRLPYSFAQDLFPLTKLGLRVVVARNSVAPVAISHPLLFRPTPFRDTVALLTQTAVQPPSSDATDAMKLGAIPPGDPLGLANRTAALQAIMAAKAAEADAAQRKADAARLIAKQKSAEKARAAKALRVAETAQKRAVERLADAERDLARDLAKANSPVATKETEEAKIKAATKLAKAIRESEEEKAKATANLAEAQTKLDAVKAEAQPKIDDYQRSVDEATAAEAEKANALAAGRDAERKLSPVSVFISLKTKKLYVRQAFEPIFESPVTISEPDKPIGTHIYTAVDYADGGRNVRWNVLSIGGKTSDASYASYDYDDYGYRYRRRREASAEPMPTDLPAATGALDRIVIPQDAIDRISALVLPGSSLIVSDEEAHKETGKATDFVVLISGEPQGGIKLRKRQPDPYYDDYYGYGYDRYERRGRRGPFGGPFRWW